MKLKRLFWASVLLVTFTSCVSKPIPVPGDSNKEKENLYNEYMVIADSFFELEKYDKAVTYYKMCMEKKSLYWASYYKLAKAYVHLSNWNEAANMYKVILERDPENSSIKASLAYIYAMQGNIEKALEIYNELMKLQPQNQEFLENYIAIQILSEELVDIEAPMATLIRDFPDSKNIEPFKTKINSIISEMEQAELEENSEKDKNSKNETELENESENETESEIEINPAAPEEIKD